MLRRSSFAWKIFPLLFFTVLLSESWGEGKNLRVEMSKVPNSTATIGKLDGEMDVPQSALQAALCDYEAHPRFSEVTERVAILTAEQAKAFKASKPKNRAAVEPQVIGGKNQPSCPGSTYVLSLMDFPFPMSDGWSLAVYDAVVTDGTFKMKFDTLIGSNKGSGQWTVTPISKSSSRLVMTYNFDLGVALPGFLLKWAMNSQMPSMFHAIEREAKKHVQN
jgi:hypothetical protein